MLHVGVRPAGHVLSTISHNQSHVEAARANSQREDAEIAAGFRQEPHIHHKRRRRRFVGSFFFVSYVNNLNLYRGFFYLFYFMLIGAFSLLSFCFTFITYMCLKYIEQRNQLKMKTNVVKNVL